MEQPNPLTELRKKTGMNKKQFAEYFGIPYRTLQDWELGHRHMPVYLFDLMLYKVEKEGLDTPAGAIAMASGRGRGRSKKREQA